MPRHSTRFLFVAGMALSIACIATDSSDYRAGSLSKQSPQPIYAGDPHDAWNRIFYLLFTRTVEVRLTDDFKEQGPFVTLDNVMGNPSLAVSKGTFERVEAGDRAIDPLYPNFFNSKGPGYVLVDPQFAELRQALKEACAETALRPALQRALMQSDVWAAYDILQSTAATAGVVGDRARELQGLLAQFIGKLALTSQEVASLPRNYLAAQSSLKLPELFNESSGWIEVEWFAGRLHDSMGGHRRAARVFLKPRTEPQKFLAELNQRIRNHEDPLPDGIRGLDGAALLTQVLLIDRSAKVVPSPLTYDVQLRLSVRDGQGNFKSAAVEEYELSRKAIWADASSGGLVRFGPDAPAYLPASGNDFTFASPTMGEREARRPILGNLRRRCQTCHEEIGVNTFHMMQIPGRATPEVRQLRPAQDQHARFVAEQKMKDKTSFLPLSGPH